MTTYLLAAEADKIQDFIFRSSRLREVVGASQLLSRFCLEGIDPLLDKHGVTAGQILVNDGGSFRIEFSGEDDQAVCRRAEQFGAELAELYRLALGGSLSVAEPVKVNGDFPAANEEAGKKLRRAKEHHCLAAADAHMPYVAYCASCGVGLAGEHGLLCGEKPINDDGDPSEQPRYLCRVCQTKSLERWTNRESMLGRFVSAVRPGQPIDDYTPIRTPEIAATYDPRGRNYVAYLVADGNGIGKLFGECTRHQLKLLSEKLPDVVLQSLATATGYFVARVDAKRDKGADPGKDKEIIPALPLILGGDDVFVLLPAPYALDFARRFCLAFEKEMAQVVDDLQLPVPKPTMAAAVVICKSKYPYALAHRRGQELLKEAKRMCKQLAADFNEPHSAINFEVILGNRLAGQEEDDEKAALSELRPYWAAHESNPLTEEALAYALDMETLLFQRLALKDVPNKRLQELRAAFADLPGQERKLIEWEKKLHRSLYRSGHQKKLRVALESLGETAAWEGNTHHWRRVQRQDRRPFAHGLPDLLEVWDFAQNLDEKLSKYEAEEITEEDE